MWSFLPFFGFWLQTRVWGLVPKPACGFLGLGFAFSCQDRPWKIKKEYSLGLWNGSMLVPAFWMLIWRGPWLPGWCPGQSQRAWWHWHAGWPCPEVSFMDTWLVHVWVCERFIVTVEGSTCLLMPYSFVWSYQLALQSRLVKYLVLKQGFSQHKAGKPWKASMFPHEARISQQSFGAKTLVVIKDFPSIKLWQFG